MNNSHQVTRSLMMNDGDDDDVDDDYKCLSNHARHKHDPLIIISDGL
jgi:hypothetical protein